MHFDLTDLRLFVKVHEAGTITGGAERVHMTLASASERIRGMEDELGVALLLRDRRGVRITPAGRTLLQHARALLLQVERMQGDLGEFSAGLKGQIRMLCNTSAMSEHLPDVLSGFLAQQPGISVDLEERSSNEIVEAVRAEACDIGLASDLVDFDGLQTFAFCPDPLAVIVPRDHLLAQSKSISLAQVADCDFVGLMAGSALQEHVAQHARRLGKRLNYRIRLRSFESICRVVGAGIGVGIVPRVVAQRCARSARISRLELTDAWAARHLVICVKRMDALPVQAQRLVAHLLAQDRAVRDNSSLPGRVR